MGLDREYRSDDGGRSHLRGIKVGCTVAVGGAEEAIATVLNTCDQDILVLNTWKWGTIVFVLHIEHATNHKPKIEAAGNKFDFVVRPNWANAPTSLKL